MRVLSILREVPTREAVLNKPPILVLNELILITLRLVDCITNLSRGSEPIYKTFALKNKVE